MRNFNIIPLALIISLVSIGSTGLFTANILGSSEAATVTWKTFNDRNGLFTIEYPSNWIPTKVAEPLGPGPIDVAFWYYGKDDTFAYIEVYADLDSIYADSRTMMEAEQAWSESTSEDYRLEQGVECAKYIINGARACSMIDSFTMPDEDQRRNVLYANAVNNSGIEYRFTLSSSEDIFEHFRPVFDHMVRSFRLTGIL
jgi:hypothetical protein